MHLISTSERLKLINTTLIKQLYSTNFLTAFLANIYKDRIQYSSAGHPVQYLYKSLSGDLLPLKCKGKPLCLIEPTEYEMVELRIESGDVLILFSDGIFEEFNHDNEEFGEDRLEELIKIEKRIFNPDYGGTENY